MGGGSLTSQFRASSGSPQLLKHDNTTHSSTMIVVVFVSLVIKMDQIDFTSFQFRSVTANTGRRSGERKLRVSPTHGNTM